MKKVLKICKYIAIGILSIIILFNTAGILQRVFFNEQIPLTLGFGNAVILTGSMEPAISPGDMVIIQKQSDYDIGDIVTYRSGIPITHRITQKKDSVYITQGDANNSSDGDIEKDRVIGKVISVVPGAGHVILFFRSPLGMVILMLGLFASIEVPKWYKKYKRRECDEQVV